MPEYQSVGPDVSKQNAAHQRWAACNSLLDVRKHVIRRGSKAWDWARLCAKHAQTIAGKRREEEGIVAKKSNLGMLNSNFMTKTFELFATGFYSQKVVMSEAPIDGNWCGTRELNPLHCPSEP